MLRVQVEHRGRRGELIRGPEESYALPLARDVHRRKGETLSEAYARHARGLARDATRAAVAAYWRRLGDTPHVRRRGAVRTASQARAELRRRKARTGGKFRVALDRVTT